MICGRDRSPASGVDVGSHSRFISLCMLAVWLKCCCWFSSSDKISIVFPQKQKDYPTED